MVASASGLVMFTVDCIVSSIHSQNDNQGGGESSCINDSVFCFISFAIHCACKQCVRTTSNRQSAYKAHVQKILLFSILIKNALSTLDLMLVPTEINL